MAAQQTGTPTNTGMTAGQGTDLYGTLASTFQTITMIYRICVESIILLTHAHLSSRIQYLYTSFEMIT